MTEPDPVVVHRDRPGSTWTRLPSSRSGQDVLSARWRGLGEYAVLRLPGAHPRTTVGLSAGRLLGLVAGVVLLVAVTLTATRRRA